MGSRPSHLIVTIFGMFSGLADIINCAKFQNDRSRGYCLVLDPEIDRVDPSSRSISGQIESIVGSLKSRSSLVDRRERSTRSI
jgi:hypothetical protein